MPDKANNPLPEAPDLNETASAIARGRELVKQAQRLRQGDRIWRWWLKTGVAGGGVAGL
jgi:hypothetical protein